MKKNLWLLVLGLSLAAVAVYAAVGAVFFLDHKKSNAEVTNSDSNATYYTVTFDTRNGSAVASQKVKSGAQAEQPTTTRSGYEFLGWYVDVQYETKFDFVTPITADITLYAKWMAWYTVEFNVDGGEEVATQEIMRGMNAKAVTPTKTGYVFLGWYYDAQYQQKFDFTTLITNNLTLYAKWARDITAVCDIVLSADATSYVLKKYNGDFAERIILPQAYQGLPVTEIADYAFEDCNATEIIIPSGYTSIGDNAFENATALTSIVIPSSVNTMGQYVFRKCTSLTTINYAGDAIPTTWDAKWQDGCSATVVLNYCG